MKYMIGVDVGGTFTDFSVFEQESGRLFHFKHSSTNYDSSVAIVNGILEVLNMEHATAQQVVYLAHGTTVSTNALIEKKGAKVGVITTEGFNDIMEIGIQKRPFMYDTLGQKPEPLIMSGMNRGVPERIAHDGSVVTPLDEEAVRKLVAYFKANGVNSIAVSTLFSFINPAHEKRIKEIIAAEYPGVYTTISSELVPEFREYSRMSTTVLNAYLGPRIEARVIEMDRQEHRHSGGALRHAVKRFDHLHQGNHRVPDQNGGLRPFRGRHCRGKYRPAVRRR